MKKNSIYTYGSCLQYADNISICTKQQKEEFRETWDKKYPNILKSWDKNWAELTTFFEYPHEIRKIIYTTNAVESYHRMVRKFTKSKSIFLTDDSIRKAIYLSVNEISKNGLYRFVIGG